MFLDEIAAYLTAQGLGTVGGTFFLGSGARIPDGSGPYVSLIETGGTAPRTVHNAPGANVQRPTASITVRASAYDVARIKAKAVYLALNGIYNTTLSGTFYQSVVARQEPTDIGLDSRERRMIVFNIEVEKSPS